MLEGIAYQAINNSCIACTPDVYRIFIFPHNTLTETVEKEMHANKTVWTEGFIIVKCIGDLLPKHIFMSPITFLVIGHIVYVIYLYKYTVSNVIIIIMSKSEEHYISTGLERKKKHVLPS